MGRKKAKSPAQQARARYLEIHKLKGSGNANIWFTRCLRTGIDVVLLGDPRIEHFYMCEGDPDVAEAFYCLEEVTEVVDGSSIRVKFDARVEHIGGQVEYRIVGGRPLYAESPKDQRCLQARLRAAERLGGEYRHIALQDLDAFKQRILSWRRALRFLRASAHHYLGEAEGSVRGRMQQQRRATVGELLECLDGIDPPILIAAIVSLIYKRALTSDLDQFPLSSHTVLVLRGEHR